MTGFGEATAEVEGVRITVEVRSINNRHLKLNFRSDPGYGILESQVESLVRKRIHRGAIQLGLRVTQETSTDDYRINLETMRSYQRQLAELSPDAAPIPVEALLALPGVIDESPAQETNPRDTWPAIEPVIIDALTALQAMRCEEGQALAADLLENCDRITAELTAIESLAPNVANAYRTRLVERVNQALADLNVTVEPADLVREVALFADRSDISEETVRLRHHLEQFIAVVNGGEGGRKLEFITQEMGRETNTIGSKAGDSEISVRIVTIKTALERIREQVQNVE